MSFSFQGFFLNSFVIPPSRYPRINLVLDAWPGLKRNVIIITMLYFSYDSKKKHIKSNEILENSFLNIFKSCHKISKDVPTMLIS